MRHHSLFLVAALVLLSGCEESSDNGHQIQTPANAVITDITYDSGLTFRKSDQLSSEHTITVNTDYQQSIRTLSEFGQSPDSTVVIRLNDSMEDMHLHGLTIMPEEMEIKIGESARFTVKSDANDTEGEHRLNIQLNNKSYLGILSAQVISVASGGDTFKPSSISLSGDGKLGLAATDKGQVYLTQDSGLTWVSQSEILMDNIEFTAVSPDGRTMFVGGQELYASFNQGASWQKVAEKFLSGVQPNRGLSSISMSNNADIIIVGRQDVISPLLISQDGGRNWEVLYAVPNSISHILDSVAMSGDGQIIFATEHDPHEVTQSYNSESRVYYSLNHGEKWSVVSDLMNKGILWQQGNVSLDGSKILVIGKVFDRLSQHAVSVVYQSLDSGHSWSKVNLNFNLPLSVSYISDDGQYMFVAGDGVVAMSNNHGQDWRFINNVNLVNKRVMSIKTSSEGSEILIGLATMSFNHNENDINLLRSFNQGDDWQSLVVGEGSEITNIEMSVQEGITLLSGFKWDKKNPSIYWPVLYKENKEDQLFYSVW